MEQIQNFIKGLKSQTHMSLGASAGGMIRSITEPQVKYLIKKMCLNEYISKSERSVKLETFGTPKGMLVVDTHTAFLAQIELLNRKLAECSFGKANVSQVQALRCDLCGEGHENGRCSLEGSTKEAKFSNFNKNNPYSNTYSSRWKDHPNFQWSNS